MNTTLGLILGIISWVVFVFTIAFVAGYGFSQGMETFIQMKGIA